MFPNILEKYTIVSKVVDEDGSIVKHYGGALASKKRAREWAAYWNDLSFESESLDVTTVVRIGDIPIGDITDDFFGFDDEEVYDRFIEKEKG